MCVCVQVLLPVPGVIAVGGVPVQGGRLQPRGPAAQGARQRSLPLPRLLRQCPAAPL